MLYLPRHAIGLFVKPRGITKPRYVSEKQKILGNIVKVDEKTRENH
jgi:hypothetical protein